LRQRREDIPLLAEHLLGKLARKYAWPNLALSLQALTYLCDCDWRGNVRELQNVLARAAILARGRIIGIEDVQTPASSSNSSGEAVASSLCLRDVLAETERRIIRQALDQEKWNRTRAARLLGISRRQLFDKIRQYDLHE
jgi:two-component system response regulator AtoC